MTISVEELTVGLARIEWKTSVKSPGRTTETFRLEKFQPITSFTVYCRAKNISCDTVKKGEIQVICSLIEKSSTNNNNNANADKNASSSMESEFESRRKPSKGWIVVNGSNKTVLKELPFTGKWKGVYFFSPTHLIGSGADKSLELNWTIWLEFPSQKPGVKKLLRRLSIMYLKQTDCDVQFRIGDDQIGGHVNILSVASPVFAAMFSHEMKESRTHEVVIEDIPMDIFKILLNYIYSGRLSSMTREDTVLLAYLAADKYVISDMKEDCVELLLTCIRVHNALALMSWAHTHSISKLKEATLVFIGQHSQEIYEQEEWGEFIQKQPDLSVMVTRHVMKITFNLFKNEGVDYEDLI